MKISKIIVIALTIISSVSASAKAHYGKPPKHLTRICRDCDGRGKVRTWKNVWLSWRKCRDCDGRGYFVVKPPPPPPPKFIPKHAPKHPPKVEKSKHHKLAPVHKDHDKKPKSGSKGRKH
jgi:outer membrane biosynthesis protein TonB